MARRPREWRNDQLWCRGHADWHHHSRFNRRKRQNPDGTIWDYDADCKLWQQTHRVAVKHEDEARQKVEGRAKSVVTAANKADADHPISLAFVMDALNYRSLIPVMRMFLTWPDEVCCPNCASHIDKFEFDHRAPPRHPRDWARLHARNVGPLDHECNNSKQDKPYEQWLDEEEDKRLSAVAHNDRLARRSVTTLTWSAPTLDLWVSV